jgi:hypothetical protein
MNGDEYQWMPNSEDLHVAVRALFSHETDGGDPAISPLRFGTSV